MKSHIVLFAYALFICSSSAMKMFCPVKSPSNEFIYFTDKPSWTKFGLVRTQCTLECSFCSSKKDCGNKNCHNFNYNSTSKNCSLFNFEPTHYDIDQSASTMAYRDNELSIPGFWPTVPTKNCSFPFDYQGVLYSVCPHVVINDPYCPPSDYYYCKLTNGSDAFCLPDNNTNEPDINECLTNNGGCSPNASCTNTFGSLICTCLPQYFGNGFNCTTIIMKQSLGAFGAQTVRCPSALNLLSCGVTTIGMGQYYISSIASGPTISCTCFDSTSQVQCVSWCTNAVQGFEIITSPMTVGTFTAICSAGKKVLGCGIYPQYPGSSSQERFRQFYPNANGTGCICYDGDGAQCVATCAENIINHEVVSITEKSDIHVPCPSGKYVLGCGVGQQSTTAWEEESSYFVSTDYYNSCACYNRYGVTCYATCGNFGG